jgi:hypothetical protein
MERQDLSVWQMERGRIVRGVQGVKATDLEEKPEHQNDLFAAEIENVGRACLPKA